MRPKLSNVKSREYAVNYQNLFLLTGMFENNIFLTMKVFEGIELTVA